jgi:hypothetical protein
MGGNCHKLRRNHVLIQLNSKNLQRMIVLHTRHPTRFTAYDTTFKLLNQPSPTRFKFNASNLSKISSSDTSLASYKPRRQLHPASCAPVPARWDGRCTGSPACIFSSLLDGLTRLSRLSRGFYGALLRGIRTGLPPASKACPASASPCHPPARCDCWGGRHGWYAAGTGEPLR